MAGDAWYFLTSTIMGSRMFSFGLGHLTLCLTFMRKEKNELAKLAPALFQSGSPIKHVVAEREHCTENFAFLDGCSFKDHRASARREHCQVNVILRLASFGMRPFDHSERAFCAFICEDEARPVSLTLMFEVFKQAIWENVSPLFGTPCVSTRVRRESVLR